MKSKDLNRHTLTVTTKMELTAKTSLVWTDSSYGNDLSDSVSLTLGAYRLQLFTPNSYFEQPENEKTSKYALFVYFNNEQTADEPELFTTFAKALKAIKKLIKQIEPAPVKDSGTNVERLANEFSRVLTRWIGTVGIQQVNERNEADKSETTCASHDFCDSNMAMDEAFKTAIGREWVFYDDEKPETKKQNERDTDLVNAAWSLAKSNKFQVERVQVVGGVAMVHVFTVYKKGTTTAGPVPIMREATDKAYDVAAKINFYESLGYTVTDK